MTIRIHLAKLLGERKLRASELARRSGISKNTISALWHERSSGIRFDTLDSLCNELKCQVGEILEYVGDETGKPAPPLAKKVRPAQKDKKNQTS